MAHRPVIDTALSGPELGLGSAGPLVGMSSWGTKGQDPTVQSDRTRHRGHEEGWTRRRGWVRQDGSVV